MTNQEPKQVTTTEPVVRCSAIGSPCLKKIWLEVTSGVEPVFSEDTLRIFDVGTALEPVAVEWLIRDGFEVEYNAGSQEAEIEIMIPLVNGEMRGHHDCIIRREEGDIMIDIKTMNDRAYGFWKKAGTLEKNLGYAMQATAYAGAMDCPFAGIMGVNKNNSQYHLDVWDFDQRLFDTVIARANILLDHKTAPEPGSYQVEQNASGTWIFVDKELEPWVCKYCWAFDQGLCDGQE